MSDRIHIALMGVDGAGKSTLAGSLTESIRAGGRDAEIVSFKRAMAHADPLTSEILGQLASASLMCQYADAEPDGTGCDPVSLLAQAGIGTALVGSGLVGSGLVGSGLVEAERRLRAVSIRRNVADPFLSSALLEVVGGFWVHRYVESRLREGIVVVDESYAFKHALKNVLIARRLTTPGSAVDVAAQRVLDVARSLYGCLLQPTHGYWIDTDPALSLRWRSEHAGTTTSFETYGLTGDNGKNSFLAMQHDCREAFESVAKEWGWHRIEMSDRPCEDNMRGAVDRITDDLR